MLWVLGVCAVVHQICCLWTECFISLSSALCSAVWVFGSTFNCPRDHIPHITMPAWDFTTSSFIICKAVWGKPPGQLSQYFAGFFPLLPSNSLLYIRPSPVLQQNNRSHIHAVLLILNYCTALFLSLSLILTSVFCLQQLCWFLTVLYVYFTMVKPHSEVITSFNQLILIVSIRVRESR